MMSAFLYETEPRIQKKRYSKYPKLVKLSFGDFGLIILQEGRVELVQIGLIRKMMKHLIKKRDMEINWPRTKIWYNLSPNFVLQWKTKNSRMGKGKGLVERRTIRVRRNTVLFEFVGVPYYRLLVLERKINKKLHMRVKLINDYIKPTHKLWSNSTKCLHFYKKYLATFL